MQTFTIDLGCPFFLRLLGRNPLVRPSDRVEALVFFGAALIALFAVPIVAAVGTSVHDGRSHAYAEQAQNRHQIAATAIADAEAFPRADSMDYTVAASWNALGSNHVGTVPVSGRVKAGDHVDVWTDERGERASAPAAPGRAGEEALGAAVLTWLCVVATVAVLAALSRRRLIRARYVDWDRDLRSLAIQRSGDAQ